MALNLGNVSEDGLRVLSASELKILFDEADRPTMWAMARGVVGAQPWFAATVYFAALPGARRGEILALRWKDVNLTSATATISHSLTQTKHVSIRLKETKSGNPRTLSLPQTLVDILERQKGQQNAERSIMQNAYGDGDFVFPLPNGKPVPLWTFTASFRYLVKRSGVTRIRLHDLRHTHASLLLNEGIALEVVSEILGHSTLGITSDIYSKVDRGRIAPAAHTMERLIA